MPDKNLKLKATIDDAQAKAALKGLTQAFREGDAAHRKWLGGITGVKTALKDVSPVALQARDSLGRFTTEAHANFNNLLNKAVKPINGALADMGSQFKSLIKWGGAFAMITGTMYLRKAANDLVSYSNSWGLMNATLRAKLPETKRMVDDAMLAMSGKYGVKAEDMMGSFTQLLSSGFLPKNKEGTKEYNDELQRTVMMQDKIAMSAIATGTSIEEMQRAIIFTSKAFGIDITQAQGIDRTINALAGTLDQGIGWMTEYADQFVKFAADAKQAGASMEEAMGIFALNTLTQTPDRAGFSTAALLRTVGFTDVWVKRAKNAMASDVKNLNLNAAEMAQVGDLNTTQGWLNMALTGDVDGKGNRIKVDFKTLFSNIENKLKGISTEKRTLIQDMFLQAISPNVNAKRAMALMLANGEGLTAITKYIEQASSDQLIKQKFDEIMNNYGKRWEIFTNTFRAKQLAVSESLAPGMALILNALTGQMNGQPLSAEVMAEGLAKALKDISDKAPGLKPVVEIMGEFAKYVNDGKLTENLKDMAAVFTSMASGAHSVMQILNKMTGGHTMVSLGVMWFGANLISNIFKSFGASLGAGLLTKLGGSAATLVGTTMGGAVVATLMGSTLLIGAAIGVAIGTALNDKMNEYNQKMNASAVAHSENALNLTMAMVGLQKGTTSPSDAAKLLKDAEGKSYSFDAGLSNETKGSLNKYSRFGGMLPPNLQGINAPGLANQYGMAGAQDLMTRMTTAKYGIGVTDEKQRDFQNQALEILSTLKAMSTLDSWYSGANTSQRSPGTPSDTVLGNKDLQGIAGWSTATKDQTVQIKTSFNTLASAINVLNSNITAINRGSSGSTPNRSILSTP